MELCKNCWEPVYFKVGVGFIHESTGEKRCSLYAEPAD